MKNYRESISLRFPINSVHFLILSYTEKEFDLKKLFLSAKLDFSGSLGKKINPQEINKWLGLNKDVWLKIFSKNNKIRSD